MDIPSSLARLCAACLVLSLGGATTAVTAQPSIISPLDVARHHQQHSFSSDFSDTPWFDLQSPVELMVSLHHLHVPEHGYAELVFSVVGQPEAARQLHLQTGQHYIATLQLADIARAMELDGQAFSHAAPARLLGWPATALNQMGSSLLVDEIELLGSGKRLVFQVPHKNMKKHPKARWRLATD